MSKVQEYLCNDEYVTIVAAYDHGDDVVIVANDNEELIAAHRGSLKKKEESWGWKRAEERRRELNDMTAQAEANLDKIVEKVIEKATSALSSRMKFNMVFSKNINEPSGWAIMVANELNNLVKEKAPEVVKKEEFPF